MSRPGLRLEVAGVDAYLIRLGETIDPALIPWVRAAALRLRERLGARLIEVVPSYTTILVQYDLLRDDAESMHQALLRALDGLQPEPLNDGRLHEIPIWYAEEVGPDLPLLAARAGLTVEEVIALHSGQDYPVFAVGFAPCFAYLGLIDERLTAPRLSSPRPRVPAGSLGIAERQTAIYPLASPGGWNLIGRTPLKLFDPAHPSVCRFEVGDRVRFVSIGRAEYLALGGRLDDRP
ncbi:5-oxoprolinase subunit PxpB [Thiofaba sp. EF100]|uniref:5-oxoprolinase subunit PxpB n=1 Tax=Thiofaba sp. EF100 TaxID=3121274 RepID=UPI003221F7A0